MVKAASRNPNSRIPQSNVHASKYGRYARAMACQMRLTEADTMFTIETINKPRFAL
jgi:hypothetical protein